MPGMIDNFFIVGMQFNLFASSVKALITLLFPLIRNSGDAKTSHFQRKARRLCEDGC